MRKIVIASCPLCGETHFEPQMTCVDYYKSGEHFDIYRCSSCSFCFTQAFPAEAEIGVYYETPNYISHSDTQKGLMNSVYHRVRSYMLGRKARLVTQASRISRGKLLDVGAGTGYFAATMQQRGWLVDAIEKSADARAVGNEHFGLSMMPDEALFSLAPATYDAITLWHVLEHIEPLRQTCEQLKNLLTPDGVLVVAVPNCASYDAAHYGSHWAAYDVPRHLWHFTPATVATLAQEMGMQIVATEPMPFDAFYVSMLSEKNSGNSNSFVRGLYRGALAWVASIGNKTKSSSVIYIMRKEK